MQNIKNLLGKIRSIIKGYYYLLFKKDNEIILFRKSKCLTCENNTLKSYKSLGTCKICKCVLSAKTSSFEEQCPLNTPRWTRIDLKTISSRMLDLKIEDNKVKSSIENSIYTLELFKDINFDFELRCKDKYDLEITNIEHCSCLEISAEELDDKSYKLHVSSKDKVLDKIVDVFYKLIDKNGEFSNRKMSIEILKT